MLFVQIIGLVATAFEVASVQRRRRKNILAFQLFGNMLWFVHFLFLGAATGAVLNIAGGIRAYTFNRFGSSAQRSNLLLVAILGLISVASIATWQMWHSALPFVGMMMATIGMWNRKEQVLRFILLFSSPLWLAYNIFSGSYTGILNEALVLVSIVIALYRYRKQQPLSMSATSTL